MRAAWRMGVLAGTLALATAPVVATVWALVAPKAVVVVDSTGAYFADQQPQQYIAADGWFLVIGAVVGLVVGLLAWWRWWRPDPAAHGIALVVGLAVGGVASGFLAAWLGHRLGPEPVTKAVLGLPAGSHLSAPISVRAWGVVAALPVAAVAAFGACVAGGRDGLDEAVPRLAG